MIKNGVFISGDIVEITGKNIKEKYRGKRGKINKWISDNIYIVDVFMNISEISLVLKANEMILIQSNREYPTD